MRDSEFRDQKRSRLRLLSTGAALTILALAAGCGDDENGGGGNRGGSGGRGGSAGAAGKGGSGGTAGSKATGGSGGSVSTGGTGGSLSTGGTGGSLSTGGTGGGEAGSGGAEAGSGGTAGDQAGGTGGAEGGTAGVSAGGTSGGGEGGTDIGGAGAGGDSGGAGGDSGAAGDGGTGGALTPVNIIQPCTSFFCGGRVVQEFPKIDMNPGGNASEGPNKLFDTSTGTKWFVPRAAVWVQYEFPTAPAQNVVAYGIGFGGDAPDRDPINWVLLGNDTGPDDNDSSDSEWTPLDVRSNPTTDSTGAAITHTEGSSGDRNKLFVFNATTPGAFKFYRLKVTSVKAGGDFQMSELQLYTSTVQAGDTAPANIVSGGTIAAFDPESAEFAFDGKSDTKWLTHHPAAWIHYGFPEVTPNDGRKVVQYSIVSANDDYNRDPKDWVLQGSNDAVPSADDTGWTEIDSRTNIVWPNDPGFPANDLDRGRLRGHKLTFTAATPGAFRHYRLKVIKNAGNDDPDVIPNANIIQLAEIELDAN